MSLKRTLIMAVEPLPPGEWLPAVKKICESEGFKTCKSRSALLVWKDILTYRDDILYSEGAIINRLWLNKKRWSLSIINRRIYFQRDQVTIDSRPEYLIVEGKKPKSLSPQKQLEIAWNILGFIKRSMKETELMPVKLEDIDYEENAARQIYIGNDISEIPLSTYNALYTKFGFDHVPKGMEITICPLGSISNNDRSDFVNHLIQKMKDRNMHCAIKVTSLSNMKRDLDNIKDNNRTHKKNNCILFIMPSRMVHPCRDTLNFFDKLEMLNIPFRRAYCDDPFEYSVPNQLPSILMAAGGRPHRSPYYINEQPIWTIGVDMGHSSNDNYTNLALTLVNPDGILIKAWVAKQSLDETIQSEKLRIMLQQCCIELKKHSENPFIVFLRDGRYFENDEICLVKNILGGNISIFEYRKKPNPQLFFLINGDPIVIDKVHAAIIPNTNTIYLSTLETINKKSLPKIAKVTWKTDWNGLKLTPEQISGLLMQSATAPGLGTNHRLLPASIYWADGIASTSETDLRFRGQMKCIL